MPPAFLLLGDSHTGVIRDAAAARGLPVVGGPIGIGRDLNRDFFDLSDDGDFVFRDPETEARYRAFLEAAGVNRIGQLRSPLVTTIGFNVARLMRPECWAAYTLEPTQPDKLFLSREAFQAAMGSAIEGSLAFYAHAKALSLRVFGVLSPQLPVRALPDLFFAGQDAIIAHIERLGVELVDVRAEATGPDRLQRAEFRHPDDPGHGNTAFGDLILDRLAALGAFP